MINPFSFFKIKKNSIRPILLLSLDGWGIAPQSHGNAVAQAHTPNLDSYPKLFPHTSLIASGETVGLPANEVGNSEVGHLTMGAGRVILQSLKRINASITNGDFYKNTAFKNVINQIRQYHSRLHIIGVVGSGNVHGSVMHLNALIELCNRESLTNVAFHLFTDGRDSAPQEAVNIITQIDGTVRSQNIGRVVSICGRYYAMDRDSRWQRTQKTYEMIVEAKGKRYKSVELAIEDAYKNSLTDEFVPPSQIESENNEYKGVQDNDGIIMFNFRSDRVRQLSMALSLPNFENPKDFEMQLNFAHGKKDKTAVAGTTFVRGRRPKNLFIVTMTEYLKELPIQGIAFPLTEVEQNLTQIISEHNLKQLSIAESEKETMVTYYFNGLRDRLFPGEDVIVIPSQRVPMYDKKPEMSIQSIVKAFKKNLAKSEYHFFMMNFANPDMVAHTGNLQATIRALEYTDRAVGEVVNEVLKVNGTVFITADHGNAEELLTYPASSYFFTTHSGKMNTDHSNNPVPFYCLKNEWRANARKLANGSLSDVAPTVLGELGIEKPAVMTGVNLLQ